MPAGAVAALGTHAWAWALNWSSPEAETGYRAEGQSWTSCTYTPCRAWVSGDHSQGPPSVLYVGCRVQGHSHQEQQLEQGKRGCLGPTGTWAIARRPSCLPYRWSLSGCHHPPSSSAIISAAQPCCCWELFALVLPLPIQSLASSKEGHGGLGAPKQREDSVSGTLGLSESRPATFVSPGFWESNSALL